MAERCSICGRFISPEVAEATMITLAEKADNEAGFVFWMEQYCWRHDPERRGYGKPPAEED